MSDKSFEEKSLTIEGLLNHNIFNKSSALIISGCTPFLFP